jgi:hypothetical protein
MCSPLQQVEEQLARQQQEEFEECIREGMSFVLKELRIFDKKECDSSFAGPVTDDLAPGYSDVIKNPMDLKVRVWQPLRCREPPPTTYN